MKSLEEIETRLMYGLTKQEGNRPVKVDLICCFGGNDPVKVPLWEEDGPTCPSRWPTSIGRGSCEQILVKSACILSFLSYSIDTFW